MPPDQLVSPVLQTCKEAIQPFTDGFVGKTLLAFIGISAGFFFGVEFYQFIWILVVLVVLDSVTGLMGAYASKEVISSKRFITSVPKLLRYLVFLAAGHLLQQVVGINLYIENAILIYLAATEFISVAENLGKAGMPLPKKLLNKIEGIRDTQ